MKGILTAKAERRQRLHNQMAAALLRKSRNFFRRDSQNTGPNHSSSAPVDWKDHALS